MNGNKSSRQVLVRGPDLPVYNPFIAQERSMLNADIFNMPTTGACFTSKGALGRCVSLRQCYPYFKQEANNFDNWILGMYDTCSYFTTQGRQVCIFNLFLEMLLLYIPGALNTHNFLDFILKIPQYH